MSDTDALSNGVHRPPRATPSRATRGSGPPNPGDVLTCGRLGKLLKMSPRTVATWIDHGRIKGHVRPGSKERRVHAADLVEFMLTHGMFRLVAECVVAEDDAVYVARLHDRWGVTVARVAPRDGAPEAGWDWLPLAESRYVLKAATPEAYRMLVDGGFRFEDGR